MADIVADDRTEHRIRKGRAYSRRPASGATWPMVCDSVAQAEGCRQDHMFLKDVGAPENTNERINAGNIYVLLL